MIFGVIYPKYENLYRKSQEVLEKRTLSQE
jgi:hypothetical protein